MKRFPFLDWMRGLAVVIMIQCHTFNSLARLDLRDSGPYVLSQFIGGMAAPLFLFMAGMTFGFQMDSLGRREANPWRRWLKSLRRAGYILVIAFLFRFTNWFFSFPHGDPREMTRVDILNCMALAMGAVAVAAVFDPRNRARFAVAAALTIALAAPVISNLSWAGAPQLLHEYLAPGFGRGRFPFFPCAAYLAFGLAAGAILKATEGDRTDRLMQWWVLIGFSMIFAGQYSSNLPYSIYSKSEFWTDGPTLILIRTGISLLLLAGSYLWTQYCARPSWSWMQTIGKNSLMVYWVHVMLVYGALARPLKRGLDIPRTALATVLVTALMIALSAAWIAWKTRRAERWRAGTTVASGSPQTAGAM